MLVKACARIWLHCKNLELFECFNKNLTKTARVPASCFVWPRGTCTFAAGRWLSHMRESRNILSRERSVDTFFSIGDIKKRLSYIVVFFWQDKFTSSQTVLNKQVWRPGQITNCKRQIRNKWPIQFSNASSDMSRLLHSLEHDARLLDFQRYCLIAGPWGGGGYRL